MHNIEVSKRRSHSSFDSAVFCTVLRGVEISNVFNRINSTKLKQDRKRFKPDNQGTLKWLITTNDQYFFHMPIINDYLS